MIRRKQPATVVLCATAPRQAITGRSRVWLESVRSVAVPVTWAVGIDTLADIAGQDHGLDLALDIPPAACGSRSRLREILLRGRDLMPDLAAVEAALLELPDVQTVAELHVWGISTSRTALTAHLMLRPGAQAGDALLEAARQRLETLGIRKSTIQLEWAAAE